MLKKKVDEEAVTLNLIVLNVEANFTIGGQGRDYAMGLSKARLVLDTIAWFLLIDSDYKPCR